MSKLQHENTSSIRFTNVMKKVSVHLLYLKQTQRSLFVRLSDI